MTRLVVRKSVCDKCSGVFETFHTGDSSYGERLILTEDGLSFAYINLLNDSVYNELIKFIDSIFLKTDMNWKVSKKRLDILNKLFNVTCDEVAGKQVDASRIHYACPYCGFDQVSTFEYNPSKTTEVEVDMISHLKWGKLAKEQQRSILQDLIHS